MRELGLAVTIDAIGNIVGVRGGREDLRDYLARHRRTCLSAAAAAKQSECQSAGG